MNPVRPHLDTIRYEKIKYKNTEQSKVSSGIRPLWYYTYVLKSEKDRKFYTGITSNIEKRFKEHNDGLVFATKNRCPFTLIYFEACLNKNDAYRRDISNGVKGGLTG